MESVRVPPSSFTQSMTRWQAMKMQKPWLSRIPNAKLLSIPSGGHLLLGSSEIISSEIAKFLNLLK